MKLMTKPDEAKVQPKQWKHCSPLLIVLICFDLLTFSAVLPDLAPLI